MIGQRNIVRQKMMTPTTHCPGGYEDDDKMDMEIPGDNVPRHTGSVNMLAEVCHVVEETI